MGFPETVYCSGKTPEQVTAIVGHLAQRHDHVLATRATPEHAEITLQQVPRARYRAIARAITVRPDDDPPGKTGVVLLSAGTADLPVAEEALLTASMMGQDVEV